MALEGSLNHERAYRTAALLEKLAHAKILICGAGAVGSNLLQNLARQGFARLAVVDRDRVEASNLATQTYRKADLGAQKATALKNDVFRIAGVEIEATAAEVTDRNATKLFKGASVVVDGFDNAASRALVARTARELALPCLHVGLAADYAEVMWEADWRCPSGKGEDMCDYPLARNLIVLATAVASESLIAWVDRGAMTSWTITLKDLAVRPVTNDEMETPPG